MRKDQVARVTIYTTMFCGFCARAKHILKTKGVDFEEIDVSLSAARRREMAERAGGDHRVPQIWIGETHIGGSDALDALEREGKLDQLLKTYG